MKTLLAATALALTLAACSTDPADPAANNIATSNRAEPADPAAAPPGADPSPAAGNATTPEPAPEESAEGARILTLDGLGPLRIGFPVPPDSGFAERGAQIPDSDCRTVSSPAYPGVYAIIEGDAVRRITVGQRSDVKLIEGIGTGATEKQVMAAFGGFRATPHKYVEAPAKYLTAPNAASGDPALRFEIDRDRKVSAIHVGTMPVLGYVEGCA